MREASINTYGWIWSTPALDCVRELSERGHRAFELMIHPPHLPLDGLSAAARAAIRAAAEEGGGRIASVNLPSLDHNLASPIERVRAASIEMFDAAIGLAADFGAPWLVVVPGRMSPLFPPPVALREAWIREGIERLLPLAEARGVGLAIENVPFAAFPGSVELAAFVRGFGSPAVGVCWDAANAHFVGEDMGAGLAAVADLLKVVHLSDTTRTVWRHDRLGLGDVPVADFVAALDATGFAGACTLEIIDPAPDEAIAVSLAVLASLGIGSRDRETAA
ncbi:sugar phosphate isomerase/epimerase [Siculibacillus lacustris]|uniref:Sugar phosphate isomerase/epimerase n=1 Tax=Siculibacillus lacustris TaxID=1549641 RepID=A0A4Q9VSI7_9HYPH|nr:sugar phosphate isomerase/epimerase family protein [Siculibacillus lacustris]TBW38954.1 sugar phosphate isomerase/epimerase [Siculibacillus lacustris]